MKRFIRFAFVISAMLLTLTSCTGNWFGKTFEFPWWMLAIPLAVIAVISYYLIFKSTYACPYCGFEFKPKRYELSALLHFMGSRLMKCPSCGKRGYCKHVKK